MPSKRHRSRRSGSHSGSGHPAVQRKRSRKRRRRSLRPAAFTAAAVVVMVGAFALVLALDALEVRRALVEGREEIARARQALGDGETGAAEEAFVAARAAVDRASGRTNRLLWRAASSLPLAGRTPRAVVAVVDVADAAVAAGHEALVQAGGFLGDGDEFPLVVTDGRVGLGALDAAADAFSRVPVRRLRAARDRLAEMSTSWVPEVVREGRRDVLRLADDSLAALDHAGAALQALPGFLGADGPRRYFVGMQNNAELRGTGGIMGSFAVLEVDDGRLSMQPTGDSVDLRGLEEARDGVVPDGFADRYDAAGATWYVPNVNVDPDLPTVAPILADLYEQRTGQAVDGVIMLDPVGLGRIMQAIGAVEVPPGLVDDYDVDVPNPLSPERIPQVTMIDAVNDRTAGPRGDNPRDLYLRAVADVAFGMFVAGDWDPVQVTRAVVDAAASRHLQLYSAHADEQAAFVTAGVAGRLAADGGDRLAISANNAAGNKMDVHLGHEVSGSVELVAGGDGGLERHADVTVTVDNPLPDRGLDEVIIGSIPLDPNLPADYYGPPGLNRTWFTVWAPDGTTLEEATDPDGGEVPVLVDDELRGELAVDHTLETPSQSRNGFRVQLRGPVEVARDGPDLVYRLTVWQQAKAIPTRLDLRIGSPAGWDPVEVRVAGGGNGAGLGVHGEAGPPVGGDIEAGAVTVRGDASADVEIEVRYSRGLWPRLREWLRSPAF